MLRRDPSAVSAFLEKLGLNVRARTVLQQAGVASREDILAIGYEHFRRQKNCGAKSLKEIGLAIGGWPELRPALYQQRKAGARRLDALRLAVRNHIIEHDLTQSQFAGMASMSGATLIRTFDGFRQLTFMEGIAIAKALEIELDELAGLVTAPPDESRDHLPRPKRGWPKGRKRNTSKLPASSPHNPPELSNRPR